MKEEENIYPYQKQKSTLIFVISYNFLERQT